MCLFTIEKDFESSKKSSNNKRNETSLIMGLQTMYLHQQHTSRYSMLAHSRPHMTTIKEHPISLQQKILKAYIIICKVLESSDPWENQHPFCSINGTAQFDESWYNRINLRKELQDRLFLDDIEGRTESQGQQMQLLPERDLILGIHNLSQRYQARSQEDSRDHGHAEAKNHH
jgi:hypothetical protein